MNTSAELPEKAMAPHSSILAWRIPWVEEPGGLQSMGSLELDMTERLHFHFSLSCIGEGNGNPLQCSFRENPGTEEPGGLQSMGSLELDTTERLPFHISHSCTGEGSGNPLQCSCLENPRDGGAWWAAVCGVAQSQT